ncbi:hypothetical protein P154DRAFT_530717 [Amniculicola lignicola CBS 123094]|uniref:Protein kinase domain-containing protein n=1 Tax=Amniculicola lignicola CBS 123094 TaxID=1392246 RepID=A0A6A5WUL8_9PLEO|nr:hypothetical protein P154DRAFT_530717 [Amniculicola lignicola CBS 123094]
MARPRPRPRRADIHVQQLRHQDLHTKRQSLPKLPLPGPLPHRNPSHHPIWRHPIPISDPIINTTSGFLPLQSYFQTPSPSSYNEAPTWHLVTPLVKDDTLVHLAHLHEQQTNHTFREPDALYRPAFNTLLQSLTTLHAAGFCHDDIKPANIFVSTPRSWILGDLGNVRHLSHPYHTSRIWRSDSAQLADCRANDAVRLLKTYLQFIRQASSTSKGEGGIGEFDVMFYEGREPLSILYWWSMSDTQSISAEELRIRSLVEPPELAARFQGSGDVPELDRRGAEVVGVRIPRGRWSLRGLVGEELRVRVREGEVLGVGVGFWDSSCCVLNMRREDGMGW